jgi:hypothetical protein
MSEPLHLDNHPDAEQLSAFAEHALPEHERIATLAHLADCMNCREIVFLAQQAAELKRPVQEATPSRLPWLSRWNLIWPVAAALACVLVTVVTVHRVRRTPPPQQARNVEPRVLQRLPQAAPSQPVTVPTAPPVAKPLTPAHLPATRKSDKAAAARQPAGPGSGGQLFEGQTLNDLPLQARNVPALVPLYGRSAARSSDSVHGRAVAGAVSHQTLVAPQQAPSATDSVGALNQTQDAAVTVPGQNFRQQVAVAPPPSLPTVPQSTNQTVAVTSAAPAIQTENPTLAVGVLGAAAALPAVVSSPLPSKLPTKVRISNGHETLAADAAGRLFLSQDAGVHWQEIKQQWSGKVAMIVLTSKGAAKQPETDKAASSGAMRAATSLAPVSRASSIEKPWFELTTDTGATWTSSDGFIWRRK